MQKYEKNETQTTQKEKLTMFEFCFTIEITVKITLITFTKEIWNNIGSNKN